MIIKSQFFKDKAAECRALEAEAIKWRIRQALAKMAAEFEQVAADLELKEQLSPGAPLQRSAEDH
jgi:hypothetical protein